MGTDLSEAAKTNLSPLLLFFQKAPIFRVCLVFLLSLAIAFLMSPQLIRPVGHYELGQYTTFTICAPFDFSVTDDAATERKQDEAMRTTVPVADYDPGLASRIIEQVQEAFETVRQRFVEAEDMQKIPEEELRGLSARRRNALIKERVRQSKQYLTERLEQEIPAFEKALDIQLTPAKEKVLVQAEFDKNLSDGVATLIREAYSQPVAIDLVPIREETEGDPEKKDGPGKLTLKDTTTGTEKIITDISIIRTPKQIERMLTERAASLLPQMDSAQRSVALYIARTQIKPNLLLNAEETQTRRLEAREAVIPVSYAFKKNQAILGEGQEVTEQKLLVLNYLRTRGMPKEFIRHLLGSTLLLFMVILFGSWIADINVDRFTLNNRDVIFIALSLVLFVLLFRIWLFMANEVAARFPTIPQLALVLVFPVGMMAMQTRFMLNFEVAIFQSAIVAFLSGMLAGMDIPFAVYTFLVCLVAAHVVRGCSRRSAVLKVGLWIGVASVAGALCMVLLSEKGIDASFMFTAAGAFAGGLLTSFAVLAISPVAEWAFGYTTDITLLELSNYEHPLLKRIMVETPGTFQHSVNIGVLAEAAAEVVGANPLLVRIGSLYHDSGKTNNPKMFTENQSGDNLHDSLSPEQSAYIIRSHVTEGVQLVKDFRLSERIADFVLEHHGTGVIKYFLEKARAKGQEINLSDFTYPGPKPRSKETGILMIADQVEATSRSVENRTADEFQQMVLKTISRIHAEGQLDECPLTLKDLARIQESFVQVLVGIHHNRIKYPEPGT